jgi:hypothetical protein
MPELYEVVGSILRDIAQARCLSDLYSRDVSRYYAEDRVLRYFPVPRTEITEASFTVSFLIREVVVDPNRMNIRNARLSQVFERYASEIVRAALTKARSILDEIGRRPDLTQEQRAALTAFANGFLSEDYRNILRARFVRYFEEHREDFVKDKTFLEQQAARDIAQFVQGLGDDPLMQRALAPFSTEVVQASMKELLEHIDERLKELGNDNAIENAIAWAKDFKIEVDVGPEPVQAAGASACTVSVKTTVRNYVWSKVDEDPQQLQSLRTLQPE